MEKIVSCIVTIMMIAHTQYIYAQLANQQTVIAKIEGECDMCKETIEKAGNIKYIADVTWHKESKTAVINYDTTKTTKSELLKRIALAGYDNEEYLAPTALYNKLPECCQYERPTQSNNSVVVGHTVPQATTLQGEFNTILEKYFELKDALVQSHSNHATLAAAQLDSIVKTLDINKLSIQQQAVWTSHHKQLLTTTNLIHKAEGIEKQRQLFAQLSELVYPLAKISDLSAPIYYQNCPMYNDGKGANWLSRKKNVNNPYYGSKMLTCGSTKETIQ
jgi:hypothetical protein